MDKAKTQVLRYLGHHGQEVPAELDVMITECMALMAEAAPPRSVRSVFTLRFLPDGILLGNAGVTLRGNDISRSLNGCGEAVLFAATLGVQADNLIRKWENADLTRSLVLDACATQLIEQCCDDIETDICRNASASGLMAARRFSPGYGDLALSLQPDLIALLDANRKIGLTCTESFILLPRKSVTALIGLGKNLTANHTGCDNCPINAQCGFRKGI